MNRPEALSISECDAGQRLDRWLRRTFPGLPQSRIERLCRKGQIRIGGRRAKPSDRIAAGQRIMLPPLLSKGAVTPRDEGQEVRIPEWFETSVLHQDEHLIVINKPQGVAVQGGTGQSRHIDRLAAARFPGPDGPPRLVHRLDKATSGLLALARTRRAAAVLSEEFRCRRVNKIYLAIIHGCPDRRSGRIESHAEMRRERDPTVSDSGNPRPFRAALTEFAVIEKIADTVSLAALKPVTGRTHQLRIHMADMGHPIVGDRRYGIREVSGSLLAGPLMLHAKQLEFSHPLDGRPLRFEAPLPPHFQEKFRQLGWNDRAVSCNGLAGVHV